MTIILFDESIRPGYILMSSMDKHGAMQEINKVMTDGSGRYCSTQENELAGMVSKSIQQIAAKREGVRI